VHLYLRPTIGLTSHPSQVMYVWTNGSLNLEFYSLAIVWDSDWHCFRLEIKLWPNCATCFWISGAYSPRTFTRMLSTVDLICSNYEILLFWLCWVSLLISGSFGTKIFGTSNWFYSEITSCSLMSNSGFKIAIYSIEDLEFKLEFELNILESNFSIT